jgi:hypothetical protein
MRTTPVRLPTWLVTFGLLWAPGLPVAAQDQPPSSVAVFRIEPRGLALPEDQVVALSAYLGEVFAEKSRSRTVNWLEMLTRLPEGQDPLACSDRTCQRWLEREFGVDYSLATTLVPLGQGCVLTGVIYAAGGEVSVRTGMARGGCDGDALVAGLEALSVRLVAAGPLWPGARPGVRARADAAFADLEAEEAGRPVGPGVSGPVPGPVPGEVPPPVAGEVEDGEQDVSALDAWPRFMFTLSASYSPAPLMTLDSRVSQGVKQPDQIGPQLLFEVRLGRYFTIGGHLAGLWAEQGTRFVEAAARFGFHIPLVWKLALYGRLGLGLASWQVDKRCCGGYEYDFEYFGLYGGLGVGLRLMLWKHLGIHFEVAGSVSPMVNQHTYYAWDQSYADYRQRELQLWKLEFNLGVITGW